ncbi:hypothetical protein RB195_008731 [Necator americanus]|uniref:Uncharacterized protein n=1 Tax=Necator americanus TaxID=51031 RepID=A0ABR1CQ38_NECAM
MQTDPRPFIVVAVVTESVELTTDTHNVPPVAVQRLPPRPPPRPPPPPPAPSVLMDTQNGDKCLFQSMICVKIKSADRF